MPSLTIVADYVKVPSVKEDKNQKKVSATLVTNYTKMRKKVVKNNTTQNKRRHINLWTKRKVQEEIMVRSIFMKCKNVV